MRTSKKIYIAYWLVLLIPTLAKEFIPLQKQAYILQLLTMAALTILIYTWFIYHAEENQFSASRWFKIGVLALGVIFLPIYLVKIKTWKEFLLSIAKLVLHFAIVSVIFSVVMALTGK